MEELLGKLIDTALPVVLGYIVWMLKEDRAERKANTLGMKEVLGYMIDRWHEEFILQGYVTTDQYNGFKGVYEAYAANRGNGAREAKWKEIQRLPIDDTKPSMSPFLQFYLEQRHNAGAKA